MTRRMLLEMDVEDMIEKMNVHIRSQKPFTHLEIIPYLQQLEDAGSIMLSGDHGKKGIVYSTIC